MVNRERQISEIDPEEYACKMLDYIYNQQGIIRMDSLGSGFVNLPGSPETTVYLSIPVDDFTRDSYKERGFSQDEIDGGIIALVQTEPVRSYKMVTLSNSGEQRVVESKNHGPFSPTNLTFNETYSMAKVATLSAIPGQILDNFGSAQRFEELLSSKHPYIVEDLMGMSGLGIYPFGLRQFVEGVELMRRDEMHSGDSRLRAVSGLSIKDRGNYFESVLKKLAANKRRNS